MKDSGAFHLTEQCYILPNLISSKLFSLILAISKCFVTHSKKWPMNQPTSAILCRSCLHLNDGVS
jgi:hypothetical protein